MEHLCSHVVECHVAVEPGGEEGNALGSSWWSLTNEIGCCDCGCCVGCGCGCRVWSGCDGGVDWRVGPCLAGVNARCGEDLGRS